MAETWRPAVGYEGLYEVSDIGRVQSVGRTVPTSRGNGFRHSPGKVLSPIKTQNGYLAVDLCKNGVKKRELVHRLVALAFIENPGAYPMINHKDEDKKNNHAVNLEWCTAKYNTNYGSGMRRSAEKLAVSKCKKVGQYLNGVLITTYPSTLAAGAVADPGHISACCLGKRKSAGGYQWKYM